MFSEIAFPPIIMLNTVIETRQHVFCVLYLVLTTSYSARSRGPCDPLVPQYCMLPFPNSFYTKGDPTSATGYAVHIEQSALPPNTLNKAIDPQEWNGFGKSISLRAGHFVFFSIRWILTFSLYCHLLPWNC